ncbi:cuticle protein 7-like [Periplaneta americana]|uniref:cuticle protein 7-like n=1 Tax=Periplaneta americana TaxID=6978 RepID=UPI0037E73CF3
MKEEFRCIPCKMKHLYKVHFPVKFYTLAATSSRAAFLLYNLVLTMSYTILFLVAVATVVLAVPVEYEHYEEAPAAAQQHHEVEAEEHYDYAPAHYEFKYAVKDEHTHDIKEQHEKRDGDKVEGYYTLLEPDGTTRTVHYTADKHTGFHAQVVRSGHAVHPVHQEKHVEVAHHEVATPEYQHYAEPQVSHQEPEYAASSYSSTHTHH